MSALEYGVQGFASEIGVRPVEADDGSSCVEFDAREEHLNPGGTVHGGVVATLVDTAMGQAVRSVLAEGEGSATTQLNVTYLRPGRPGKLQVTARVRKRGEHLIICEAEVDQEQRTLAHALATFAVVEK